MDKMRSKKGLHPNSLANLKKIKPGEVRNPNGRPRKDVSLTSLLKAEMEKIPEVYDKNGKKNTRTWRELLVEAWLRGALKNPVLLKELLDRLEGKVAQPVTGEGGGPIKSEITINVNSEKAKALTEQVLEGKGTE
jgi:hypothetical protein